MKDAIAKRLIVAIRGKYLQFPLAGEIRCQRFRLACDIDTQIPGRLVVGVDHDIDGAVPFVD
jgi:hypothetical protein